ncbi:circularly permuted type 2 ATP-grasp protein [Paraburkholderia sp. J12]|uniref:circularly permuted type 2 ATP-grasp protein n=1 Tax=Paraburkholderia sp. J12 TaxID=2805432 RepID=UPI002ABD3FF2|nr:circularly permuted type 2 ATP-grasp protein [Paraburkholderia sp. J12]
MSFQSILPLDATASHAHALSRLRLLPPRAGHWDELRDESGALREPWRQFFELLGEEGAAALEQSRETVARQVRDNDISYNVYADKGESRPWALDLLPFLIDDTEWAQIEQGVIQRARLLEAIVADTYGAQTLLARGLVPPALVFGHPGYLRPVKGYTPPGGGYLQLVAIDLARSPEGAWTVMSHRTEAPSGLGYALENRLIVSSLFADAFRTMRVRRLAPAYSQLIATLADAARTTLHGDEAGAAPHLALLTPGPFSETYFEHAFLARYLGVTLVEGKDLTVRDDMLYLKTFKGLERVHAVLRRLDDVFCDPVELRADSTIGVPGLLQVMRAGNVIVSNVPGSGFVESPALHGFMPELARALLGETLALLSVPTWWCGEAAACEAAFGQLDEAFLVPTWPSVRTGPAPGLAAGRQPLPAWRERIEHAADAFTIQAPLSYSCTPRYEDGTLAGRPSVLRVYAIADLTGNWRVVPGGFTRLAAERQTTESMQLGGSSVDTWVLSKQPSPPFSLLPSPMKPGDLATRTRRTVSSRAAENLFWSGRYGERAENGVRLCRLILGSLESNDVDTTFTTFVELASLCGLITGTDTVASGSPYAFEHALVASLGEQASVPGIGHCLASQARACGEVRGRLSSDHWRTILAARNDFRDALVHIAPPAAGERYDRVALMDALEHLATQLLAISGAQGDRMTRDETWRLLFAGRHIERMWAMATFLRTVAANGLLASPEGFDLLLQLFDSTLTYRSMYPGRLEVPALLDLLVIDEMNPRGLYGVYARLRQKLAEIEEAAGGAPRQPFAALMPDIATMPTLEQLCTTDQSGGYPALVELCDRLCAIVMTASTEISARYFSHAAAHAAPGGA